MYNDEPVGKMVAVMYEMQDKLNIEGSGWGWRTQAVNGELDFRLAMQMEAAELIDHLGWKWWKAKPPYDKLKCKLEVVDIWHFFLSDAMACDFDVDIMTEDIISFMPQWSQVTSDSLKVAKIILRGAPESWPLLQLTYNFFPTFKELYLQYIGKNTLNAFRYANGYKEGTYFKHWGGAEDNDVMQKILAELRNQKIPHPLVSQVLTQWLEGAYAEVVRTGNEQLFT